MELGFLSQKESGVGRGVKEKQGSVADNSTGDASAAKEVISPSVVDKNVEKKRQSSLVDTTGLGSSPSLSTKEITMASNASGKSSYANVIGESSKKAVNNRTLFTPGGMGLMLLCRWSRFDLLAKVLKDGPWFIRNHPLILQKWNPDVDLLKEDVGNVPVWLKLHGVPITAFNEDGLSALLRYLADVELKDTIMMAMPKHMGEGYYTCIVRVENEWKPPRCSCCKVFGHTQEECPKNIGLSVAKNLKKPSQTSRGVSVGVEPTNEVSNSNPFDVLNLVDNDVEFGTNGGTTNLVNNEVNSTGSSFMNVKNSSTSTTPIIGKSEKFEDLLISGQAILVNDVGNPLKKVECPGDYDSEDEVASVDNNMARSMASKKVRIFLKSRDGAKGCPMDARDTYGFVRFKKIVHSAIFGPGSVPAQEIQAYAIIWISEFEVARRKRFMFLLSSHFVYLPLRN
nr:hypothetical protein [Tanacetum cinerariifolium]